MRAVAHSRFAHRISVRERSVSLFGGVVIASFTFLDGDERGDMANARTCEDEKMTYTDRCVRVRVRSLARGSLSRDRALDHGCGCGACVEAYPSAMRPPVMR